MQLHAMAREFYHLGIGTEPAVTAWEASFDGGETWSPATVDQPGWGADDYGWLVAGDEVDQGSAVAVITESIKPLVRAIDSPEIVVRDAPGIYLLA